MLPMSARKIPMIVAGLFLVLAMLAVFVHLQADSSLFDAPFGGEPDEDPCTILSDHGAWLQVVAFSPDGNLLASGAGFVIGPGEIVLRDLRTNEVKLNVSDPKGSIYSLAFSPDSRTLATGSKGGSIRLWDTKTGRELAVLSAPGWVNGLAFAPDGNTLAACVHSVDGTRGDHMVLWDVPTKQERAVVEKRAYMAFSPDGRSLATVASNRSGAWIQDRATGQEREVLRGPLYFVNTLAFTEEGLVVASGGHNQIVQLWDATTGQKRFVLRGHTQDAYALAFSPDGRTLATGSSDRTIKLWDVVTGEERTTLRGHTGSVYCVAFSPDGRWLASGGFDKTVRLWPLEQ